MKVNSEQAAAIIKAADDIVITGHCLADGDSIGSMLALYQVISNQGKKIRMVMADGVPGVFKFLPDSEKVLLPWADIAEAGLFIVVDTDPADSDRLGTGDMKISAPVLNIDHHPSNSQKADYVCLKNDAAATGEIIAEIITYLVDAIDIATATSLYVAIVTDCGFFCHTNTTAATFELATQLVRLGVNPHDVAEKIGKKRPAYINTLIDVLDSIEYYAEGRLAIICANENVMRHSNEVDIGKLIDIPQAIDGVEVTIMLKETIDGNVRVSFRSRTMDVSSLAAAFGGGGHCQAAGFTLTGSSIENAKSLMVHELLKKL